MTERPASGHPDGGPPVPDYDADPAARRRGAAGFTKGLALALVAGLLCFGLLFMAGAENFEDSPPGVFSIVGLGVPPLALVAMLVYAFRAKRNRERAGFAAGMFVGLGLSALPVGWCYVGVADAVLR